MIKPGQQDLDRVGPGQLIDDPAAAQQHDDRYTSHTEARRQGRVFLGVDLDDGRFAGQFICYGPHRRCE